MVRLLPVVAATVVLLAYAVVVYGNSSAKGFINIDCGIEKGDTYTDPNTGLVYTSDFDYIESGKIHKLDDSLIDPRHFDHVDHLRSFPTGKRNCYTVKEVERGGKYLVRASFMYGNYDGENKIPKFDLYLGVNIWHTISLPDASNTISYEIITVTNSGQVSVCLVNTDSGTPFISALELRPLPSTLYEGYANSSQALVPTGRINFGGSRMRYPHDPRDRIWNRGTYDESEILSTPSPVTSDEGETFEPPTDVMKTASYPASGRTMALIRNDAPLGKNTLGSHVFFHFAELQQLGANETRVFTVTEDGENVGDPIHLSYLETRTFATKHPIRKATNYALVGGSQSTLPPLINALESYNVIKTDGPQTDADDADAINAIKIEYNLRKNWMGDPCSPTELKWDGLNCSLQGFLNLRIISLVLNSSGLTGEITPSFSKLSQLQHLDLSGNGLTGDVPDSLANLNHLIFLNLSGNKLIGNIPKALLERKDAGILTLSLGESEEVVSNNGSKPTVKILVAVAASLAAVVIVLISVLLFRKRKRHSENIRRESGAAEESQSPIPRKSNIEIEWQPNVPSESSTWIESDVPSKSSSGIEEKSAFRGEIRQLTLVELRKITNGFSKEIDKGGFGPVYYGKFGNIEVAVKMLANYSSQGPKEFEMEANLLTGIYHKNLVSLIGYCNYSSSLSLVYEYMAGGNLRDHLTGKSGNTLSWIERLEISVDSAQGLEYLHVGCKPAIVHRDVKTRNILLDKNQRAKLSDFGLCSFSKNDAYSHISTVVKGTTGYLDPEYALTSKLNEKSDVFSFGVVLLELITGLPAVLRQFEDITLVQWVRERFERRGEITEIIDRRICEDFDINSVRKVVETAMACLSAKSVQRPTMSDVLVDLRDSLKMATKAKQENRTNTSISIQLS